MKGCFEDRYDKNIIADKGSDCHHCDNSDSLPKYLIALTSMQILVKFMQHLLGLKIL